MARASRRRQAQEHGVEGEGLGQPVVAAKVAGHLAVEVLVGAGPQQPHGRHRVHQVGDVIVVLLHEGHGQLVLARRIAEEAVERVPLPGASAPPRRPAGPCCPKGPATCRRGSRCGSWAPSAPGAGDPPTADPASGRAPRRRPSSPGWWARCRRGSRPPGARCCGRRAGAASPPRSRRNRPAAAARPAQPSQPRPNDHDALHEPDYTVAGAWCQD